MIREELVPVEVPQGFNVIIGQAHFIKTVEDLYETLATSFPGIKFGLAFCESSGKALVRHDGNDEESVRLAVDAALRDRGGPLVRHIPEGQLPHKCAGPREGGPGGRMRLRGDRQPAEGSWWRMTARAGGYSA
jgi:Uncharacterized conserved protein